MPNPKLRNVSNEKYYYPTFCVIFIRKECPISALSELYFIRTSEPGFFRDCAQLRVKVEVTEYQMCTVFYQIEIIGFSEVIEEKVILLPQDFLDGVNNKLYDPK